MTQSSGNRTARTLSSAGAILLATLALGPALALLLFVYVWPQYGVASDPELELGPDRSGRPGTVREALDENAAITRSALRALLHVAGARQERIQSEAPARTAPDEASPRQTLPSAR